MSDQAAPKIRISFDGKDGEIQCFLNINMCVEQLGRAHYISCSASPTHSPALELSTRSVFYPSSVFWSGFHPVFFQNIEMFTQKITHGLQYVPRVNHKLYTMQRSVDNNDSTNQNA